MRCKIFLIVAFLIAFIVPEAYSFDVKECVSFTKQWESAKCYHDIAIELNDSSICDKSEQYLGDCYYQIAIKTDNLLLCDKAIKFKSECHRHFAFKNEDLSICSEKNTDECILNEIKDTKNYELCYRAMDPQECFEQIYYDTQDTKLCQYLKNTSKSDILQECNCAGDEILKNGSCVKLGCKPHQGVEKRSCVDKCEVGKIYDENDWLYSCKYPCKYGINSNTIQVYLNYRWNCNNWDQELLFYYSLEIPTLFLLFSLIIFIFYFFKFKIIKKPLISDSLKFGFKYLLILLNITIFIFLFEREPYDIVESFYDNYLGVLGLRLLLLFSIPFIVGIFTFLLLRFIKAKTPRRLFVIENLIFAIGISIFIYFLKFVVLFFEEHIIAIYLYPLYLILFPLGEVIVYVLPIIEPLYTISFFFVLITSLRYIKNKLLKKIWQSIFEQIPKYIIKTINAFFIFVPLVIFLDLGWLLSSTRVFADWLLNIGLEELLKKYYIDVASLNTRIYYSSIIYSLALSIIFILAKYAVYFAINKFKSK